MKKEMKMKTPLLLILSLIGLNGITSANGSELNLADDDMWSINGGVFKPSNQAMPNNETFTGPILVKGANGVTRLINLSNSQGLSDQVNEVIVLVDRTPPVIAQEWTTSIEQADGVKIGPNTQLNITVNEGLIKQILVDGQAVVVSGGSHAMNFSQKAHSLMVEAEDDFNNISRSETTLIPDYQVPVYSWELVPPSVLTQGQWYAGKSAELKLSATDDSGVAVVELNQVAMDWQESNLVVSIGDEIQIKDTLGNAEKFIVNWQVDSDEPKVIATVNGEATEFNISMTVGVNDLIDLTMVDDGVGVKYQQYKGKSRKWQPLPKKFRFTSQGRYRIQIQGEDQVGNELVTTVKFKVKR